MTNNIERINMEEDTATNERPKKLRDYHTSMTEGYGPSIVRPPIGQNNFELKPDFISMIQNHVQFFGLPNEDLNQHIANFLEYCDTVKMNGVSNDAIRLRLFSFSLRDKAKAWVQSQPAGAFTTWEELSKAFIYKYFPPSRASQLKNKILGFQQMDGETLYEAWERYKDLLRKCPNHELPKWVQVQTFYNGSLPTTQETIDAASGGPLNNKTLEEAEELIETLASNHYAKSRERARKQVGVYEVDQSTAFAAQMTAMQQQLNQISQKINTPAKVCELCNVQGHSTSECQVGNPFAQTEQANYLNFQRGQGNSYGSPYPHNYIPNWRTQHPNLSWSNNNAHQPQHNQNAQQQQSYNAPEKKSNIEDMLSKMMSKIDKTTEQMEKRLEINEIKTQNHDATLKSLERQMGQIHGMLSQRQPGQFPSDTERNPKEQVNAILLRSGKQLEEKLPEVEEKEKEKEADEEEAPDEVVVQAPDVMKKLSPKEIRDIPFPHRLKRQADEKQYSKFLNMFRSLHINVPFADLLEQMPKYAKFLKEIISNKKRLSEHETVMLTEEISALLRKRLPPKLNDAGSFSIPVMIGETFCNNALCDLGASVNIMPYSLFQKLDIGEVRPTTISLQLADRSIVYPRGIIEDVLMKVEHFIFPIDFVVLDMEEDRGIPLILERPFLRTGRTLIDVHGGKLILRVGEDKIEFNFQNSIKYPPEVDSCWAIQEIEDEPANPEVLREPLERCLMNAIIDEEDIDDEDIKEMVRELRSLPIHPQPRKRELPEFKAGVEQATKEPPKLELKQLPTHLRYAYLG